MKLASIFCLFVLLASTGLVTCVGPPLSDPLQEQYDDYIMEHGRKKSTGIVNRQSDESDTAFLPTYTHGTGIKFFCVTKSSDFKPCLSKGETPPNLSVPKDTAVSFYVWESDTKAATGFYVSSHRGKILKHHNEFENFKEMVRLYLVDQGIHELAFAFNELKNLVELDLHMNALKRLRPANFKEQERLQKLNVRANKIASIDDDAFSQLKSVVEINLSENEMTALSWNLFAGKQNLTILILNDNKIGEITGFSTLRINENDESTSLQTIPEGMSESAEYSRFRDSASKLNHLELQNNFLTTLEDLLPRTPNVEYLDVSNNLLEAIGRRSFLPLKKLKVLNLRKNKLKVLYREWFYAVVANTKGGQETQIDIAENEWRCFCEILAFAEYHETLTNIVFLGVFKSLQVYCFTPKSMEGDRLLQVVKRIREEYECPVHTNDDGANGQPPSGTSTKQETTIAQGNIIVPSEVGITLIAAVFIAIMFHLHKREYRTPQVDNAREHRELRPAPLVAGNDGNNPLPDNDDSSDRSEARPTHGTPSTKIKIKKSVTSSDPNTKPMRKADDTADQQGQEHLDEATNAAPAANLVRIPLHENHQKVEDENLQNEALDPENQPIQNPGSGHASN